MTRMWMLPPEMMCQNHRNGEHYEIHKVEGNIIKGRGIDGYLEKKQLEPKSLFTRHDELASTFKNHKSPMRIKPEEIPAKYLDTIVDKQESIQELSRRCPECKKRIEEYENSQAR